MYGIRDGGQDIIRASFVDPGYSAFMPALAGTFLVSKNRPLWVSSLMQHPGR